MKTSGFGVSFFSLKSLFKRFLRSEFFPAVFKRASRIFPGFLRFRPIFFSRQIFSHRQLFSVRSQGAFWQGKRLWGSNIFHWEKFFHHPSLPCCSAPRGVQPTNTFKPCFQLGAKCRRIAFPSLGGGLPSGFFLVAGKNGGVFKQKPVWTANLAGEGGRGGAGRGSFPRAPDTPDRHPLLCCCHCHSCSPTLWFCFTHKMIATHSHWHHIC